MTAHGCSWPATCRGRASSIGWRWTAASLEQLTSYAEPVDGQLFRDDRLLLEIDEGGNERSSSTSTASRWWWIRATSIARRTSRATARCSRTRRIGATVSTSTSSCAELESGEERSFELGGWCASGEISPDGRWVVAGQLGELSGDSNLFLLGIESGEIVHVTPHEGQAEYMNAVWLADSSGFLCATNEGRDTFAISRYTLGGGWEVVVESDWDLGCVGGEGSLLVEANEDGYSRLELRDPATLELREEVPLPGRGVAEHFVFSPDGRGSRSGSRPRPSRTRSGCTRPARASRAA